MNISRQNVSCLKSPLVALAFFLCCSCGPAVKVAPPTTLTELPTRVAILPPAAEKDVAREKLALLQQLLISGLSTHGYLVLDPVVVRDVCGVTPQCANIKALKEDYGVDAVGHLSLKTASGANFLAGYYREITGKFDLESLSGAPIYSVSHTERSSGGLILESGQVIQAFRSLVKEFQEEERAQNLAQRFTEKILESLPNRPPSSSPPTTPQIVNIKIRKVSVAEQEICLQGSAQMRAFLLLPDTRSSLREIDSGRYCGIFTDLERHIIRAGRADAAALELRSPFGLSTRTPLTIALGSDCPEPAGLVAQRSNSQVELSLVCSGELKDASSCATPTCSARRVVFYRATNSKGPFTRIAETRSLSWIDRHPPPAEETTYSAISFDDTNSPSQPLIALLK